MTENAPHLHPLKWVGMQGIDLPVSVAEPGYERELPARADLQVDLPVPHVKGIHMSRLYRLLDAGLGAGEVLSPLSIKKLLQGMIDTHDSCGTESARLKLNFNLLLRRSALIRERFPSYDGGNRDIFLDLPLLCSFVQAIGREGIP
jgi:GTP cyclohydrolase I